MAGFGIDPTSLSLSPSGYLSHRRARKSQDIGEAQYEQSRQDASDRFAESMISKEADRKARFAEIEFNAEQDLIKTRAAAELKIADDTAKTEKAKQDAEDEWVNARIIEAVKNENANWDQKDQLDAYFRSVYRGQAPEQSQIQPPAQPNQVQDAEQALQAEVGRMEQPRVKMPHEETGYSPELIEKARGMGVEIGAPKADPYMQKIIAGTQPSVTDLLPAPPEQQAVPVPDYLRREAGVQPKPKPAPKEEIPEAIRKSTYASEYKRKTKSLKFIDKEITRLEKSIKSKELNFNRARNKASLKALKIKRETNQSRIENIERLAGKEWEAKQEKIDKVTPRETTKQKDLIKYFEDIKTGVISRSASEGFSKDSANRLKPLLRRYNVILKKEGKPELELYLDRKGINKWRLQEKQTAEQKNIKDEYNRLRASGVSKEEAMQRLGMNL